MNVRIRRLHSDVALPRYESGSAAAFDFSATEDVTINPAQVALVPTGLVIEVPEGMFLGIFARSSTPMRRGLMVANGVGVVDPEYCGPEDEVKVAVMNFTTAPVTVRKGDRSAVRITRLLADLLEQLGHTVLTRHLLLDDVDAQEGQLSDREVFERDLRWLDAADVLIAEASGSSYGVGFEV